MTTIVVLLVLFFGFGTAVIITQQMRLYELEQDGDVTKKFERITCDTLDDFLDRMDAIEKKAADLDARMTALEDRIDKMLTTTKEDEDDGQGD